MTITGHIKNLKKEGNTIKTFMFKTGQYDSFLQDHGSSSYWGISIREKKEGYLLSKYQNKQWGEWQNVSEKNWFISRQVFDLFAKPELKEIFDSYEKKSQHKYWASHLPDYSFKVEQNGQEIFSWFGSFTGPYPNKLMDGILADIVQVMRDLYNNRFPAENIIEPYIKNLHKDDYSFQPIFDYQGKEISLHQLQGQKIHLEIFESEKNSWWKNENYRITPFFLKAMLYSAANHGINWRENLTSEEIGEAEIFLKEVFGEVLY